MRCSQQTLAEYEECLRRVGGRGSGGRALAFTLAENCFPAAKASAGGGDVRDWEQEGEIAVELPGPGH